MERMTDKTRLGDGEIQGGLTEEGKTQKYQINYLPKVFENQQLKYDDKIELAVITPGNMPDKVFYHSLRFISPDQLKVVILKLINAYAYFMSKRELLNINNVRSLPHLWKKHIETELEKMIKDRQLKLI